MYKPQVGDPVIIGDYGGNDEAFIKKNEGKVGIVTHVADSLEIVIKHDDPHLGDGRTVTLLQGEYTLYENTEE